MLKSFKEAKEWIENSHRFGDKLDLVRMNIACELLDHPEKSFTSVHVAGTNGKGSTANYIKNVLTDAGYITGIYTSPYVVKFNERMGIDNDFISDDEVLSYANILKRLWDKVYLEYKESITFFEILTLMSFLYFKDHHIDIAVVEVGLGGTLDATNVITPLISVITNISYDHMKQLGNTLESIALNKLGIVKQNGVLITTIEEESLQSLFIEYTKKLNAFCMILDLNLIENKVISETTSFDYKAKHYELTLTGEHQIKNAILAIEVLLYLRNHFRYNITNQAIETGLKRTTWPGRLEIIDHQIVLDGAHNLGGALSLKQSLKLIFPGYKIICLFCMMKDKEHDKVIREFDEFVSEFHFTEIEYPRRANAIDLYNESRHTYKYVDKDYKEAINRLKNRKENEILLITGSLYFISEARAYLKNYQL